jgi:hypothetical protein
MEKDDMSEAEDQGSFYDMVAWVRQWCHTMGFSEARARGDKPGIIAMHWGDLLQAEVECQADKPLDLSYKILFNVHVWVRSPMLIVGTVIPQEAPQIDFEVQGLSPDGLKVFLELLQKRVLDRK